MAREDAWDPHNVIANPVFLNTAAERWLVDEESLALRVCRKFLGSRSVPGVALRLPSKRFLARAEAERTSKRRSARIGSGQAGFRDRHGIFCRGDARAEFVCISFGELGAEKYDLCRIIDPQKQDNQRPSRPVGRSHSALS
jgi:hypothetical protein